MQLQTSVKLTTNRLYELYATPKMCKLTTSQVVHWCKLNHALLNHNSHFTDLNII